MEKENKMLIAIAQGDIQSANYESLIKTYSDNRIIENMLPVIYGNKTLLNEYKKVLVNNDFLFQPIKQLKDVNYKKVNLLECSNEEFSLSKNINAMQMAEQALLSISGIAKDLPSELLKAVIVMPADKKNLKSYKPGFINYAKELKPDLSDKDTLEIKLTETLRYSTIMSDQDWNQDNRYLNHDTFTNKIKLFAQSLKKDFGITVPKIAVLSVGQHLERLDKILMVPSIEQAITNNIHVFGPFKAETFFSQRKDLLFDGIISLFHQPMDHAFEYYSMDNRSTYTSGLPFVLLALDEKPNYQNTDVSQAFKYALYRTYQILNKRKEYAEISMNPLKFLTKEKEGK